MSITKDQNDKMSRDIDKCYQSPNVIGELVDLIKEYNKEIIVLKTTDKNKIIIFQHVMVSEFTENACE